MGGAIPLNGVAFDKITTLNFLDTDVWPYRPGFKLSKSIKSDLVSNLFDADLPAKLSLSFKPGVLENPKSFKWNPIGKATIAVRLLNLGKESTGGSLKFKQVWKTTGVHERGLELDRTADLPKSLPSVVVDNTKLYGTVFYKTSSAQKGVWRSGSHFGVEQSLKVLGIRFGVRAGLTPEGKSIFNIVL